MSTPFNQPVDPFSHLSPEQKKAMFDLNQTLDNATLALFNSPEGDRLLDLWDDHYVRQPVIWLGSPPGSDQMREGRNAFIRAIREKVNKARASV